MPASFGVPGRSWTSVIDRRRDRVLKEIEVPEKLVLRRHPRRDLEVGADQLVLGIDPEHLTRGAGVAERPERLQAAVEVLPLGRRHDEEAVATRGARALLPHDERSETG